MQVFESKFRTSEGKTYFEQWYQTVMEASSTEYSCQRIATRFGDTHVAIGGAANKHNPPVIFLHGWSGNGMLWDLTDDLKEVSRQYRTFLVDVIGQPTNSSLKTPPLGSKGYGDWLVDLMDGLGLKQARFVGMSFGAILIAKLAAVAPERISQAVLIGPAGFSGIRKVPMHLAYYLGPRFSPSTANLDRFVRKMLLGPESMPGSDVVESMRSLFRISFQHFKHGAQWPRVLGDEEWQNLTMPSLVLTGEYDALFDSAKVVKRAKRILPALAGVERYPGLGHAMENYAMLTERIGEFFD